MQLHRMSANIVDILKILSANPALGKLLYNDKDCPFNESLPAIDKILGIGKGKLVDPSDIIKSNISPVPFNPEAYPSDRSFLRVYYNNGDFSPNEVISESQLHIDIVVANTLWLINDSVDGVKSKGVSKIRPYEIMDRVIDLVGKNSLNSSVKLKINGWNHLYINNRFNSIRLYAEYMSVESGK